MLFGVMPVMVCFSRKVEKVRNAPSSSELTRRLNHLQSLADSASAPRALVQGASVYTNGQDQGPPFPPFFFRLQVNRCACRFRRPQSLAALILAHLPSVTLTHRRLLDQSAQPARIHSEALTSASNIFVFSVAS